jgi:hypothetical protein
VTLLALLLAAPAAADWPGFRGPHGDASAVDPAVPVRWSATENVAWKVPVPGVGHSSPVVAGGRVFVTTCVGTDRLLLAYDAASGAELWRATVCTAPREGMHKSSSPANATPCTDGDRVYTTFLDAGAVRASAHAAADGRPVWTRPFPGFVCRHGFCGPCALFRNLLVVNGDSDGRAFLAAVDKATGEVVWERPRPNNIRSYSCPVFVTVDGKPQMLLAGSKGVGGFDPATGQPVWWADTPTHKFVATVAVAAGVVAATGTSDVASFVGVDPTTGKVLWDAPKAGCYVPSPLAVGDKFFAVTDAGLAFLLDARTGAVGWGERLGRHHDASPVLVNGLVYALADDGTMYVVKPGPEFDLVAKNPLGERCQATPAVAGGGLYVRTAGHLVRIATAR